MATTTLNDLYTNILGRTGDQEGMDYWNNLFGDSVDQTEANQWYSAAQPELQSRANNWQGSNVDDLYSTFLGRAGEQKGLDYWNNKYGTNPVTSNNANAFLMAAQPELQGRISKLFNPVQTPNTTQTQVPSGTVDFSFIDKDSMAPGYTYAQQPTMQDAYSKKYMDTFTSPDTYWDEYSQGVGAQTTEAAARGMAASGHTGLMPTLQTQAHQSYMSDYLPTVRTGLAAGVTAENASNNTLAGIYGNELSYNQGVYGTKSGIEQAKITAMTAAGSQNTQKAIAELENLAKTYNVDSQTMQQMYVAMAQMFPNMGDADKQAFLQELAGAMGISNYNASTAASLTK